MEADVNHDEEAYSRVDDALTCVDSAVKLQLKPLANHPMLFIKEHYMLLQNAGHRLPMMHLIVVAKVHCKEVVAVDAVSWASALRPLKKLEDTKFSIDSPSYADTSALRMCPKSNEYKMFVDAWLGSALPNPFWKLLTSMAHEEKRMEFITLCGTFMDMIESVDFEDLLEGGQGGDGADAEVVILLPVKAVTRAYKGLLALTSPAPGMGTLSDVEFVMPSNATDAAINKQIPRYGRSLVSTLRKDVGGFWKAAQRDFHGAVGCAEQCLESFQGLEKEVADFQAALPSAISEDFVNRFEQFAARCPAVARCRLLAQTDVETEDDSDFRLFRFEPRDV